MSDEKQRIHHHRKVYKVGTELNKCRCFKCGKAEWEWVIEGKDCLCAECVPEDIPILYALSRL